MHDCQIQEKQQKKIIMIGQCNHAQSSNPRKTAEIVIMIRRCNHAKPSNPRKTAEKNYHDRAVQSCTIVKSKVVIMIRRCNHAKPSIPSQIVKF
jgi:hypothetical protein